MSVPLLAGHNSPRILNRDDFPHPLGPEMSKCMPGWILKFILEINSSPLGLKIGMSLKMMSLAWIISAPLADCLFVDSIALA